jgi:hypothetical protein
MESSTVSSEGEAEPGFRRVNGELLLSRQLLIWGYRKHSQPLRGLQHPATIQNRGWIETFIIFEGECIATLAWDYLLIKILQWEPLPGRTPRGLAASLNVLVRKDAMISYTAQTKCAITVLRLKDTRKTGF